MAVSRETLTIVGVGIALAGIIFASNGHLGDRIDRLDGGIDRLESRIDQLDVRLAAVGKETARIIGLPEGIGVTGYTVPSNRRNIQKSTLGGRLDIRARHSRVTSRHSRVTSRHSRESGNPFRSTSPETRALKSPASNRAPPEDDGEA